jgi:precorrin-6B methylase 2
MSYSTSKAIEAIKEGDTKRALKLLESPDTIFIEWSIEDVIEVAKQQKMRVTNKQAREVLSNIERHHDASLGVNWMTIECALDYV